MPITTTRASKAAYACLVEQKTQGINEAQNMMKTEEPELKRERPMPIATMASSNMYVIGGSSQKTPKYIAMKTAVATIVISHSLVPACVSTGWKKKKARNTSHTNGAHPWSRFFGRSDIAFSLYSTLPENAFQRRQAADQSRHRDNDQQQIQTGRQQQKKYRGNDADQCDPIRFHNQPLFDRAGILDQPAKFIR